MKNPIDEVLESPDATTLDRVLARTPSLIKDTELDIVIAGMRERRGMFIAAEAAKAAKKEGVEDGQEPSSETGTD